MVARKNSTYILFFSWLQLSTLCSRTYYSSQNSVDADQAPQISPVTGANSLANVPKLNSRESSNMNWHPINIVFDTSNIDAKAYSSEISLLNQILLPEVSARIKPMIQVYSTGNLTLPATLNCFENLKTPSNLVAGAAADILVQVVIRNESDKTYLASGGPCFFDPETNRPIVGILIVNKKYFETTFDGVVFWVDNILHELMHILIYSSSIWDNLLLKDSGFMATVNIDGVKIRQIQSKKLAEWGRKHFACDRFDGVFMEDGGSTSLGSHLEKRFYGNEIMTSKFTAVSVISAFSLKIMEDSGYYQVDYSYAEPFMWGYQRGCSFLSFTCDLRFNEFCSTEDKTGCTHDYLSRSKCSSDRYTSGCLINEFYTFNSCRDTYGFIKNLDFETNGANSRCFEVKDKNISTAGCFKASCGADQTSVTVTVGQNTFTCNQKGQEFSTNGVSIVCPDPADFCLKSQLGKCPNDCNGRGKCLESGKCFCYFLYDGPSCESEKSCDDYSDCSKIKVNSLGVSVLGQACLVSALLSLAILLIGL